MSVGYDAEGASVELARRLLNHVPFGPSVEMVVGGLPPNLADEVPLPAGARLLGSALESVDQQQVALEVVFDASGDPTTVLSAYQQQLQELGWAAPARGPGPRSGGFVARRGGEGIMLQRAGTGPVLRAVAVAGDKGNVDLRVTLDWRMARHMKDWAGPRHVGDERMPPLYLPLGITVERMGGGGSGSRWRQEAVAYTDRSAAELEVDFAGQLAEAGWSRVDGRAENAFAWSAWRLPGQGDWRGLLLMLGLFGSAQRSLWLGIESTDPEDETGEHTSQLQIRRLHSGP